MRTKKTSKIYRTGIKGLLINNDLCFVENNISQLTQNFRLANKIKVLLVFERYQLPIKGLYICCQECYAYSTLKNKLQSTIIKKVYKPELWFLCSAHRIIVLYICMKFHENISNNF